jgi:hypothetical protein
MQVVIARREYKRFLCNPQPSRSVITLKYHFISFENIGIKECFASGLRTGGRARPTDSDEITVIAKYI